MLAKPTEKQSLLAWKRAKWMDGEFPAKRPPSLGTYELASCGEILHVLVTKCHKLLLHLGAGFFFQDF